MAEQRPIRFTDGAAYERMMAGWSRLAGAVFIDWLAPARGLRWVDVGCGNGAFTELLVARCAPAAVEGIDPSEGQLAFARERPSTRMAKFTLGDAMAMPFADDAFDAAVMALVLFFVPDPGRGVAEMVRVVRPGGLVSAYVWDVAAGGLPFAPIQAEMRAMGLAPQLPPRAEVSGEAALRELWIAGGMVAVETRPIVVERTFADFDDFWATTLGAGSSIGPTIAALERDDLVRLKAAVARRLPADAAGRITYASRANAVKGRVAG